MSTPNPVPVYHPQRPRSIFGPVLLVAVGVVLLLCTTGVLSWHSPFFWFARYWPVALILWGLARLAEYVLARQKGYPPPRLGGGSIVLLIFFVLFGMGATRVAGINWSGLGRALGDETDMDFTNFFGSSYEFTDNFSLPMAEPEEIKIVGRHGDIKVTASSDGQAHVSVTKTIRSESQSDADRQNQATSAKFEQQGKIWILDLAGDNFNRGSFNLDLELPPRAELSVSTRIGNISVEHRPGNVNLSTDHGNINIEDVKGDASVRLKGGSVMANRGSLAANNVSGNLTVDGTVNDTNITGLGGTLTMTGTYWGDMQLSHIAKQVHFMSSRTDLEFARLDGDFNMRPDEMQVNGVTGPFRLDTKSKRIDLEDVAGDVHINDSNGRVEISSKMPLGNIDVSTTRGGINLALPANAGFRFDAKSVGGEIETDFGVNVDSNGNNAVAQATVGKGGPQIRLKADQGTIRVKKQEQR
jgi:hypothetical protein